MQPISNTQSRADEKIIYCSKLLGLNTFIKEIAKDSLKDLSICLSMAIITRAITSLFVATRSIPTLITTTICIIWFNNLGRLLITDIQKTKQLDQSPILQKNSTNYFKIYTAYVLARYNKSLHFNS